MLRQAESVFLMTEGNVAKNDRERKAPKSEQTRRHIVRCYLTLMRKKKWDKITVIEICRYAEITRGTFYQYFSDIYDLLEQLETAMLEELSRQYSLCPKDYHKPWPIERFPEKYNYSPPPMFLVWFSFCKDHREEMLGLLDRKYGDTYFVKKLKALISEEINKMMDHEGTANDGLREHFTEVFVEMHFLAVQTWLDSDEGGYLSVDDIVNILNTMRVGSAYLRWKEACDPEYDKVMGNARS